MKQPSLAVSCGFSLVDQKEAGKGVRGSGLGAGEQESWIWSIHSAMGGSNGNNNYTTYTFLLCWGLYILWWIYKICKYSFKKYVLNIPWDGLQAVRFYAMKRKDSNARKYIKQTWIVQPRSRIVRGRCGRNCSKATIWRCAISTTTIFIIGENPTDDERW